MAHVLFASLCFLLATSNARPISLPTPHILGDVQPFILGGLGPAPQVIENVLSSATAVVANALPSAIPSAILPDLVPTILATSTSTSSQPESPSTSSEVDSVQSASSSSSSWALDPAFTNIQQAFNKVQYSWGSSLAEIVSAVPSAAWATSTSSASAASATPTGNVMQVLYPKGSINPAKEHTGGVGFYATPIDISKAANVTLSYNIFFPADFDFNKGGKLPGLTGGHGGCSGGKSADTCFSTRLMWRPKGLGELYLYAPHGQPDSLCNLGPKSMCDTKYGASIGRGAWTWQRGEWNRVRTDIWLNTPGIADGGFNIWINDTLVLHSDTVLYRNAVAAEPSTTSRAKPTSTKIAPASTTQAEEQAPATTKSAGLLDGLLGGSLLKGLRVREVGEEDDPEDDPMAVDLSNARELAKKPIGFLSVMFQTFFGGHEPEWASPKDQYTYFGDVKLSITS